MDVPGHAWQDGSCECGPTLSRTAWKRHIGRVPLVRGLDRSVHGTIQMSKWLRTKDGAEPDAKTRQHGFT